MIYIQCNEDRTLPHHFDCACALYGCIEGGLEYRLVSYEDVCSGRYDLLIKQHCFIGSVEFMREVFSRIGLTDVRVPQNCNRKYEKITIGEAKKRTSNDEKIFIKPFEIKLFTGFVLDKMVHSSLNNVPDETEVMAYKVFDSEIVSEWRCYVHNNKIVDSHCYQGDFYVSPNKDYLDVILESNNLTKFPVAYTIDVAILENGHNVVVEYNDMWAIGNYGIPNFLYLRLLRARYYEIVR